MNGSLPRDHAHNPSVWISVPPNQNLPGVNESEEKFQMIFKYLYQLSGGGQRSHDRIVVGFTTTCAISAH